MNSRRLNGPLLRLRAEDYHTVAEERRCASQQKLRADVADGSFASGRRFQHVGFAPESCRMADIGGCLTSAITGCEQSQQSSLYSITPSARTKNVSEIARPSVLAVFRLTISSNWVGC